MDFIYPHRYSLKSERIEFVLEPNDRELILDQLSNFGTHINVTYHEETLIRRNLLLTRKAPVDKNEESGSGDANAIRHNQKYPFKINGFHTLTEIYHWLTYHISLFKGSVYQLKFFLQISSVFRLLTIVWQTVHFR